MTATTGRTIPLVVGLVALASIPSIARAQGNVFNPYGNSGYEDYREFGSPKYAPSGALPGQAVLNSEPIITRPRANSYQQYTQELEGTADPTTNRRANSNLPYYQAYQQLNRQYNRVYRPNDTPENRRFEERMRLRDAAYSKALTEPDAAKRARLLRQVEQDSIDRPTTATRPRSTTGATTARPTQGRTGSAPLSRAPSPYSSAAPPPPGTRRAPAPSPFPSTNTPRPNAASPTPRAPATARPGATGTSTPRPATTTSTPTDPSTIPIPPPR
jgi:hypothetical protein